MLALTASLAAAPFLIAIYAYAIYPAVLWCATRMSRPPAPAQFGRPLPSITLTVPVYNAGASIEATLDGIISLDYPRDRLELLVLSDASTDGTDEIVRRFADRGVELLRAPERKGKTAGENAAFAVARGDIIVNVDATVVVPPHSLQRLVRAFDDPSVGVASGRDISTGLRNIETNGAESGYVGYEMWLRDLETKAGSIVGASGCFYGVRREIHQRPLPRELSWDFASPLVAKQLGYRSVSVNDAVCIVPRTHHIQSELRRKIRTMARGIRTLFYLRTMMNPFRYGAFALMLLSHKLVRWLPYLLAPVSFFALAVLAPQSRIGLALFVLTSTVLATGIAGICFPRLTRYAAVRVPAFLVAVTAAGGLAWLDVFRGVRMATWEPTTRPEVSSSPAVLPG